MVSTHVVASEMMDVGLGQHRVVLEFGLSQWWCVTSDDDELGLSRSEGLEGGLVTESDCVLVSVVPSVNCPWGKCSPLPDFITSARRELMLSAVFFAFLGAIVTRYCI